jgi:hypothetical protein
MGYSTKGSTMKVDESTSWANEQQAQSPNQCPANFGHWLNEAEAQTQGPKANPLINTASMTWQHVFSPTQQSTGDEYYWQHQEQLQQSNLNFDALPSENEHSQPIITNSTTNLITPAGQETATAIQQYLNDSTPAQENTTALLKKFAPLMSELEQALEQPTCVIAGDNKQKPLQTNKQSNTTKLEKEPGEPRVQFKNHHLFILGAQAELSLNLHSGTKQEQKELIQLIQNHLKKKGLRISRLIINGVNND